MVIKIYPDNPNANAIREVVAILRAGGVIAYPTDTVYAFGCSLSSPKGIEKLREIKGKKHTNMSIVCADLSNLADYAKVDNATFRILKRNLPGAFTFILNATSKTPDKVLDGRRTIGIRIPDNAIARAIVNELGVPMVTTSIKDHEQEYLTDPELIEEKYTMLQAVVDGGYGEFTASTVVDCTGDEPEIIREGKAELQ
ncbi:Hypothetical YciO protein [Mucinivorans hirudinis]|uniref:Hypothetical YciO protein n=1 Tax=Mucinivorans hirudinis TaxID=1433126 RepID=A0A060R924_9BACT|nr:Hypothetical YciO protein [Mucinivorans hirudinis]